MGFSCLSFGQCRTCMGEKSGSRTSLGENIRSVFLNHFFPVPFFIFVDIMTCLFSKASLSEC